MIYELISFLEQVAAGNSEADALAKDAALLLKDLGFEVTEHASGQFNIPKRAPSDTERLTKKVLYLDEGTRHKLSLARQRGQKATHGTAVLSLPIELDGRWVAFVPAENDIHIKLATINPVRVREVLAQLAVPETKAEEEQLYGPDCPQCQNNWKVDRLDGMVKGLRFALGESNTLKVDD